MTHIQQPSQNGTTAQKALNEKEEVHQVLSEDERPRCEQPWRTEPEIDLARQEWLETARHVTPDPTQGIYPFKGVKLARADIEWLLATHENGKGPIDWPDETQRRRQGLDLRGAKLSGDTNQRIDLRGLPLSRLRGGLIRSEWSGWAKASKELLAESAVDLEGADLFGTHLEGASLTSAHLKQADLRLANLGGANLTGAQLEEANLTGAQLEEANLTGAQLERAYLTGAQLTKANLHGAQLKQAILFGTQLKDAYLVGAQLEEANLTGAQLEGANLRHARLGRAILSGTLEGIDLTEAILADENGVGPRLAAVQWGNIDLSAVDWLQIKQLDDEYRAYQEKGAQEDAFKKAVKAYRQLALALRRQGLYEEAAYFSYRAHVLYREVLWRQVVVKQETGKAGHNRVPWILRLSKYLFSSFLHLTTGYGYKPLRSIVTYLLVIILFALTYSILDHMPLLPNALILSLTVFHGRGFFPDQVGTSISMFLIAFEAITGLLIEISYVVVFTKRFLEQ